MRLAMPYIASVGVQHHIPTANSNRASNNHFAGLCKAMDLAKQETTTFAGICEALVAINDGKALAQTQAAPL